MRLTDSTWYREYTKRSWLWAAKGHDSGWGPYAWQMRQSPMCLSQDPTVLSRFVVVDSWRSRARYWPESVIARSYQTRYITSSTSECPWPWKHHMFRASSLPSSTGIQWSQSPSATPHVDSSGTQSWSRAQSSDALTRVWCVRRVDIDDRERISTHGLSYQGTDYATMKSPRTRRYGLQDWWK